MDHTKEPWKVGKYLGQPSWERCIHFDTGGRGQGIDVFAGKITAADARRIVACVNACVGMEDPAAELSSLRSALAIAQSRASECSDREALLADNVELRSALAEKTALLESHGPEGHNVTNEQFVALRRELTEKTAQVERLREALVKIQIETWAPYEERMKVRAIARKALAATAPDVTK